MSEPEERYTHGHHESVLRVHEWRTAENSAAFLLPRLSGAERILDLGCGPGSITADLARHVPRGEVVGVDASDDVIERARRTHGDVANLSFSTGDAYALDYDDATFDVVYAHQVLQHLARPVEALQGARRLLRPGGVLAVRDGDYGCFGWWPADERLDAWMRLYHDVTAANGGVADAGRRLPEWVRAAGFRDLTVSSSAWTFANGADRTWWASAWAERVRSTAFATRALELGAATRDELEAMSAAFLEWSTAEDGVFIVPSVEVLAAA